VTLPSWDDDAWLLSEGLRQGRFSSNDRNFLDQHFREVRLKRKEVYLAIGVIVISLLVTTPVGAVNKETVQLLQQVSQIQQQLRDLQDSQIKSNAIIQKLTEQILDQVTRLSASIDELKRSNTQTQAAVGTKVDSLTGNQQILQESLDDLKARVNRLVTDLATIKTTMQSIDSKVAAPPPSAPVTPDSTPGSNPPPGTSSATPPDSPDNLYQSALTDYNGARYKLALGEFQQYIKFYGSTPNAGSAQFWIGQIHFSLENYDEAIDAFNAVIERYPDSSKVSQALYKKGLALEKNDQKAAAIKAFRLLLTRFPNSPEAKLAAQELSKLTRSSAASGRTAPKRRP
jgi:tol-pal system protein YbgF